MAEVSAAAFWDAPTTDADIAGWRHDPRVVAMIAALAPRRVPIEAAEQRITDFARTLGAAQRPALTALFLGLFDSLNQERMTVINGLERFGQRQRELAADLRQDGGVLRATQAAASLDDAKLADLTSRVMWESRVFEARRQSIRYACNVPTLIEQRLYRLTRAIRQQIE